MIFECAFLIQASPAGLDEAEDAAGKQIDPAVAGELSDQEKVCLNAIPLRAHILRTFHGLWMGIILNQGWGLTWIMDGADP